MQKGIRNAILNGHNGYIGHATNNPYAKDSQKQYYADTTKAYYAENLQYTSNMVLAQVQGVDYDNFYTFTPLRIRTAMAIDPTTGANLGSDWQRIIVENTNIDFLPRGAKVVFNGNTWLVVNPMNIESATGTSVIRRCNAIWHYLDAYGNVKGEPFCYGQGGQDMATTNDIKETMILMNSYQHCVMQLNPGTAAIAQNVRMILGNQAFAVRGLQNFAQEFTADEGSVHIQFFDLAKTEPLAIDDMDNRVAGGKAFSWEIRIEGNTEMTVGQIQTLTANSLRNGETPMMETDYIWESKNAAVATVNENGSVTALSPGDVDIVCKLLQNENNSQIFALHVSEKQVEKHIEWITAIPQKLTQYQSVTVEAAYFGDKNEDSIKYTISGPNTDCYSTEQNGNRLTIMCWLPSVKPLMLEAKCNGEAAKVEIMLEGW